MEGLSDGWLDGIREGSDEAEGTLDVVGICDVDGIWDGLDESDG